MKTTLVVTAAAALLFPGLILTGCGDDNNDMMSSTANSEIAVASISPADGSTGVSVTTSVSLKFTGPVDTSSVMHNLHLAGGQAMHEWLDSLAFHGGFNMMNMDMMDHMMDWMDSIQAPGEFHWNAAMDSCAFVPDAALMHGTEYLCLLYEADMQGAHGGMMGGDHDDSGFHMFGFTTAP